MQCIYLLYIHIIIFESFIFLNLTKQANYSQDKIYSFCKKNHNARMASNYAKRMAQLSARIFNEIPLAKSSPNHRVIERLAQKPINKISEYSMNYYPRHLEMDHLFKTLRYHGLYR